MDRMTAINRCKTAYAANNIPLDAETREKLRALPLSRLVFIATCWERRAKGLPVYESETDNPTPPAVYDALRRTVSCHGGYREGYSRFLKQQSQYHGGGSRYRLDE